MADDDLRVPKRSKGDVAHALTKAGLSMIPVVGSPAADLFQNVIQPPLEKRRLDWMTRVGEKLIDIETKGFNLEDLQKNEEFISAVMHASQIALRTHQKIKLEALRNAIVNVAIGQAPEEALQHIFIDLIDSLTELHLRILKMFQKPTPPPGLNGGGLNKVLEYNISELRGKGEFYDQLWRDLKTRGLVSPDHLHTTVTGRGLSKKATTGLGDDFLSFIEIR